MTVQELIDFLEKQPRDAQIIYRLYSEYELLDSDEIKLVKPEDKRIILHHDRYMRWYQWAKWAKDEEMKFPTVLELPGN